MEHITEIMIQNGFAIAVAVFLLLRTEKRIEELKDAVHRLSNVLSGIVETKGAKS